MAQLFTGANSRLAPAGNLSGVATVGCLAFWMKTTASTANAMCVSAWDGSSRNGCGVIINATAGKATAQSYNGSGTVHNQTGTTTVNDGTWRHFAYNFNNTSGTTHTLYINAVSEVSGASSGAWAWTASSGLGIGGAASFWGTLGGDIAEVGLWSRNLSVDEVAALAKGYSPRCVAREALERYLPLVRDLNDRCVSGATTGAGTSVTVSDHPRIMGGLT